MNPAGFAIFLPRIPPGGFLIHVKTFVVLLFAATFSSADTLQQADLAKLRDRTRRDAEVARLAGCGEDTKVLTGYHLFTANQQAGPPLHVLCVASDYRPSRDMTIFGGYNLEKPEELFGDIARRVPVLLEPGLDPVRDSLLMILDSKGREIRPFGGNNYINEGYCFDFDRDGILDRADSNHRSLVETRENSIEVFTLQSIEPQPRILLEIIFN